MVAVNEGGDLHVNITSQFRLGCGPLDINKSFLCSEEYYTSKFIPEHQPEVIVNVLLEQVSQSEGLLLFVEVISPGQPNAQSSSVPIAIPKFSYWY